MSTKLSTLDHIETCPAAPGPRENLNRRSRQRHYTIRWCRCLVHVSIIIFLVSDLTVREAFKIQSWEKSHLWLLCAESSRGFEGIVQRAEVFVLILWQNGGRPAT